MRNLCLAVFLIPATLATAPTLAQSTASELFVPPDAAWPTYDQLFLVTPPFSQWEQAVTLTLGGSEMPRRGWLHSRSLRTGGGELQVDVLFYDEGTSTRRAGYERHLMNLSCNANRGYFVQGYASVVINPDGLIVPISPIHGGRRHGSIRVGERLFYDTLCYDQSFRARFMPAQ